MHPPGASTVLVRYGGEISLKSTGVRGRMERQLAENLEALLADRGLGGTVERHPTRPLIRTDEATVETAAETAAAAPGVVSTSPALSVEPALDAIVEALARTAAARYAGGSFAVTARRAGDVHDFTSHDVHVEGGDAVWAAVDGRFEPAVDLDDPDVTFSVEVREEEAFVYLRSVDGPGGFPLGTQAPMVALISGGLDSPVAAHEVMTRGAPVRPVYLDLGDYGGPDHEARALETVRTLAAIAPNFDLSTYRVPAGESVEALVEALGRGRMLAFRRYMYRVAEHLAEREGAVGIVTGESIGQKSSQTARNLSITSRATRLPIHRPLLSLDKAEITERARRIGTFDDSTIPAGCNRFAPAHPETAGRLEELEAAEPDDLFERAERDAARARLVDPRPVAP